MKISQKPETTNIVAIGSWNTRIFSPQWISGGRLTESKSIEMEFAFGNPDLPTRFHFDDLILTVSESKIVLIPKSEERGTRERAEKSAQTICSELTHTPILAVGYNFKFNVEDPNPELLALFKTIDTDLLSDAGYGIQKSQIKQTIQRDSFFINISYTHEGGAVDVDLNFHHPVSSAEAAAEILSGKIECYRRECLKILETLKIYETEDE